MRLLNKSAKKDYIMNMFTWLKTSALALSMSLLAACGGSDSPSPAADGSTPLPLQSIKPADWGSPAVFVTPGQSSASFALTGCDLASQNFEGPLNKAKLVISSSGDVSIMGTTSTAADATPQPVIEFKFSDMTLANWAVQGTVEDPTYSIHMRKRGAERNGQDDGSRFRVNDPFFEGGEGFGSGQVVAHDYAKPLYINLCQLVDPLALKTLVNEARVATHMAQGAKQVDTFFSQFEQEPLPNGVDGDVIYWAFPAFEFFESLPQFNYRFNSATGVLLSSEGTDTTAPMTTVSFALPSSTNTESGGYYGESVCRNTQFYEFKEAKTLAILKEDSPIGALFATRYGEKLMPIFVAALFFLNSRYEGVPDCLRLRNNQNEG
jgi:hypothetical protein